MSEHGNHAENSQRNAAAHFPLKVGNLFQLSFKEEVGNAVSHGAAAALMLLALPACAVYGYTKGGVPLAVGYSVFVLSLFLMLLTSCLYHAMAFDSPQKRIFRILDHSMIYVAIAGTFTPLCLYSANGWLGTLVLTLQWLTALFGILYNAIVRRMNPKIYVTIYLIMGWAAVLLLPSIIRQQRWVFLALILLGGVLYTVGVFFYTRKEKGWYHFIFHLFILAASLSHFAAIIFFI